LHKKGAREMNANELADELVEWYEDYNGRFDLIEEAIAMLRQQQAEIEALKDVNIKQVGYISEQKLAYEKLWKEHMELFWKHEQDKELTNEQ
jgi:galactokinase